MKACIDENKSATGTKTLSAGKLQICFDGLLYDEIISLVTFKSTTPFFSALVTLTQQSKERGHPLNAALYILFLVPDC